MAKTHEEPEDATGCVEWKPVQATRREIQTELQGRRLERDK